MEIRVRDHAFDMIDEMEQQVSLAGLRRILELRLLRFGFERTVIGCHPGIARPLGEWAILAGWPDGWLDHYVERHYQEIRPIRRKAARSTRPFVWREAFRETGHMGRSRELLADFISYGMKSGITTPIFGQNGLTGTVSFISSEETLEIAPSDDIALQLIATAAHAKACKLAKIETETNPARPALTRRQIEILNWVAAGKTNWEIGEILGRSERTIEHQVAAAARRLDSVTRAQLVAEAFRAGLLH